MTAARGLMRSWPVMLGKARGSSGSPSLELVTGKTLVVIYGTGTREVLLEAAQALRLMSGERRVGERLAAPVAGAATGTLAC